MFTWYYTIITLPIGRVVSQPTGFRDTEDRTSGSLKRPAWTTQSPKEANTKTDGRREHHWLKEYPGKMKTNVKYILKVSHQTERLMMFTGNYLTWCDMYNQWYVLGNIKHTDSLSNEKEMEKCRYILSNSQNPRETLNSI